MGFELAGEIRDLYPDKAITIISSKDKLVAPEFAPKFHTAISYLLETANVQAWLRLANLYGVALRSGRPQAQRVR